MFGVFEGRISPDPLSSLYHPMGLRSSYQLAFVTRPHAFRFITRESRRVHTNIPAFAPRASQPTSSMPASQLPIRDLRSLTVVAPLIPDLDRPR